MAVLGQTVRVVVKGGGDIGTGVAWRLWNSGFNIVVTEVALPTCIRRAVSFAEAVFEGETEVEGVRARLAANLAAVEADWIERVVPVIIDPTANIVSQLHADVAVDATLAKRNLGTHIIDAPVVVALGPGFVAGVDAHAVVETMRGHWLGRVIWEGEAQPNTGVPGEVGGKSELRTVRASAAGIFKGIQSIGDEVKEGDVVASVDGKAVRARTGGMLRGLLHDGLQVYEGMKVGDVDPRGVREHCFTISDKALAVAGGVLEAVLHWMSLATP